MARNRSGTQRENDRMTGQQAVLKFDNGAGGLQEIPINNVSWSRDVSTTEVQDNQGLTPVIATTGLRFSGSFEYSGQNESAVDELFNHGSAKGAVEANEPTRGTLVVREENREGDSQVRYKFKDAMVTGQSRDYPADDIASTSFDFVAEDLAVKDLNRDEKLAGSEE